MRTTAHASNPPVVSSRRGPTLLLPLLSAALAACATGGTAEVTTGAVAAAFADPLPRSGAQTILIAMPTLGDFVDGSPTTVSGLLTLHGVTKPMTMAINSFRCIDDKPQPKQQVCGADVFCVLNRADFGITVGQRFGFKMQVTLRIQVEAIRAG